MIDSVEKEQLYQEFKARLMKELYVGGLVSIDYKTGEKIKVLLELREHDPDKEL